jgi:hypothetical protein
MFLGITTWGFSNFPVDSLNSAEANYVKESQFIQKETVELCIYFSHKVKPRLTSDSVNDFFRLTSIILLFFGLG